MRKKRTLLICAVCALLAIIALLAYTSTTAEPSYEGHPLNFWVAALGRAMPGEPDTPPRDQLLKATNAIDHIGAASLPFLLKWIQYEPHRGSFVLGTLLSRIPIAHHLSTWIIEPKTRQLGFGACYAFGVLGKRAMPALDDLCRLMNDTNRQTASARAAFALGYLGTNALPSLLTVITNANHPARGIAIGAVAQMPDLGDAAQLAVPAIIDRLTDTNDPGVKIIAIITLSQLKASPQISVPALVSCLKSNDETLRYCSAAALAQFGPQASSAIPALTNAITDSDPRVREEAAYALHQIDPATFTLPH